MGDLVVVQSYSFPHEASIARASLENAGIFAEVADEHTINANWLLSNAIGGVKVLVHRDQVDQAQKILAEDRSEELENQFGGTKETCPSCNRQSVEPHTKGKLPAYLVWLLLGFPILFVRHGWRCNDCDEFWET